MSTSTDASDIKRGHPKKRKAIMDAASRVFVERGYTVSVDEIAAEAGVSKQTIYNQFGSKEELFHAIVEERSAQVREPLTGDTDAKKPREILLSFARSYFEHVLTPQGVGFFRMLIAAGHDFPDLPRDFYETGPHQTVTALVDWLKRENARGRLRVPDPLMAAEHLASLISGRLMIGGLLGIEPKFGKAEIERRAAYCAGVFLAAHGVKSPRGS